MKAIRKRNHSFFYIFYLVIFLFFFNYPVFAQEFDEKYADPPPNNKEIKKNKTAIKALRKTLNYMYTKWYKQTRRQNRKLRYLRKQLYRLQRKLKRQKRYHNRKLYRLEKRLQRYQKQLKQLKRQNWEKPNPSNSKPQHAPPMLNRHYVPPMSNKYPTKQRQKQQLPRFVKPRSSKLSMKKKVWIQGREYAKGVFQITFIIREQVTALWYKLPNMKAFRSTGFFTMINPVTRKRMPRTYIMTRHLHVGVNTISLQYSNLSGEIIGPQRFKFIIKSKLYQDAENFVQYQWINPIMRQLRVRNYRNTTWFLLLWAHNHKIFRTIKYSFNNKALKYYLIYNGKSIKKNLKIKNMQEGRYILYIKATLKNGWKTPLLRYNFEVHHNGRWYTYYPKE